MILGLLACSEPTTAPPSGLVTGTLPEGQRALVVPAGPELLLANPEDGAVVFRAALEGLTAVCTPEAPACESQAARSHGPDLWLAWAQLEGQDWPGGALRLSPVEGSLELTEAVDGHLFPHAAVPDPWGRPGLVVVETFRQRVVWLDTALSPDEPSARLAALEEGVPGWEHTANPNGLQLLTHDGRYLALVSFRSSTPSPIDQAGRLVLWDVTDLSAPAVVWTYPASGTLGAPHNAHLQAHEDGWLLSYAHTTSLPGAGTVGLATLPDPLTAPTYRADLEPGAGEFFAMPRGVAVDGATLWITDSGFPTSGLSGRVLRTGFTLPDASGLTGAKDDLSLVGLGALEVVLDGLELPFEAWFWEPTW